MKFKPLVLAIGLPIVIGVGAFALCEWRGWPWLAEPVERTLSERLGREVRLARNGDEGSRALRVRLLGGVKVEAGQLQIAGPAWRAEPPTLIADGVELRLRYRDLWDWRGTGTLRVKSLQARRILADLWRDADGRATWTLQRPEQPPEPPPAGERGTPLLRFDHLALERGHVDIKDQQLQVAAGVDFALGRPLEAAVASNAAMAPAAAGTVASNAAIAPAAAGTVASNAAMAPAAAVPGGKMVALDASVAAVSASAVAGDAVVPETAAGLTATAEGTYRGKRMTARLESPSPLPWITHESAVVPLKLSLRAGNAGLDFDGALRELLGLQGLVGRFALNGPSLAAIGDPLGVTLPTTAPFRSVGRLTHDGARWNAEFERASLGRSHLNGSFVYDTSTARPLLTGRLGGASLWFADLGPTIGVPSPAEPDAPRAGRVLPDRKFDLPRLRAMDADVEVALQRVDLGSAFAESVAPLRGRLVLRDGVLNLSELDARTARGRIGGSMSLDGRAATALWTADLNWSNVDLERWLRQPRAKGQPPYVGGTLNGRLQLKGRGRSTAELLASAQGRALAYLPQGTISHLAVEAAGIDVAQALGLMLRGDKALPLQCAVADLSIAKGQVVPRTLIADTSDSTLWIDGRISLVDEKLDLRLQVAPKDFSPLSLRSPVHVTGTLADPDLSLEAGPLARRLVPAALLAALNPLAGVLPLIDTGRTPANVEMLASCRRLVAGMTPKVAAAQTMADPPAARPR